MLTRIPFKVSARTARLIGRENVATSKGAIIELVKNGYDADSRFSIVLIDNRYGVYHLQLDKSDYDQLVSLGIDKSLLDSIYQQKDDVYVERNGVDADKIGQLKKQLQRNAVIYIIDAGEGMTGYIIQNYWMTIGTDNKSTQFITNGGRVKVGAKGIGRFALDKLGEQCEMFTFFDPKVHQDLEENGSTTGNIGYHWVVNWNEFEGANKTIDHIGAGVEGISDMTYQDILHSIPLTDNLKKLIEENPVEHGTILKISNLRDVWDADATQKIFDDLGVLVPPTESREFVICLQSLDEPHKYGEVENSFCDDYDYKVVAHADDQQNVSIRVYRQEYNAEAIPLSFYKREKQQNYPYRREDFLRGYWDTKRSFSQLMPGFRDSDTDQVFTKIGTFDFTFYYLKRSATKNDESRFFYRQSPYNLRKSWLDKYGGIKLFRDSFRVRPYGERSDSAFDWLGLGMRKNNSPAGIAKKQGGYKVEAENIAGTILISRLSNIEFEDKSSREGLQENKTFSVFKQLIISVIKIFEEDRSLIARELVADDEDRNGAVRDRERAEELANKIIAQSKKNTIEGQIPNYSSTDYQLQLLANINEQKNEEIKQLREEQRILRALASSGLMLASFAHDLSKLNDSMDYRYDKIVTLLRDKVTEEDFPEERRKNPFKLLDQAKQNDIKMQRWLNFSTDIIKKDKRRRKTVSFLPYFENLEETWAGLFAERRICFDHSHVADISMRAFEIDFDSIFYNLISNSIEAFIRSRDNRDRHIEVSLEATEKSIVCTYKDNGPGLSPDIVKPEDIFQPLFTTKRNVSTGEETGTGLGMWLVKLIAEDNDARITLLTPPEGFGIQFIFPIKYKRS
jgi:signal transduction histidine kinase